MPKVIGLGDKTTTGGVVIECYPDVQLNNQGTTVIGMKATCPACKKGVGIISPQQKLGVTINNIQVAVGGDKVLCDCPDNTVIANPASYVVADNQGAVSMKMPFLSPEHAEQMYQTFSEVASGNKSITELFTTVANTEDWKPVPGYRGVIYHTKNKIDDYEADDLKHGDFSAAKIMQQGRISNFSITAHEMLLPASVHFMNMRVTVKLVSWLGKYTHIIDNLIDRFEENNGEKHENNSLTEAMKNHNTTTLFHKKIQTSIEKLLTQHSMMPEHTRAEVIHHVNSSVSLPKFDDINDYANGLGIAVHDIYAASVALQDIEYRGRQYRGKLIYKIQDHFGLDVPDVNDKWFEFLSVFRSWFLLQRYEGYNYQPFITEMNFTLDIEGTF